MEQTQAVIKKVQPLKEFQKQHNTSLQLVRYLQHPS